MALISLIFMQTAAAKPKPLSAALDATVGLRGRRLGDIDRIGSGKRLLQPLLQGIIEPALSVSMRWFSVFSSISLLTVT